MAGSDDNDSDSPVLGGASGSERRAADGSRRRDAGGANGSERASAGGTLALTDVCEAIAGWREERELTRRILEIIRDRMGVEVCTLRLLNEVTGELTLVASLGLDDYSKPVALGQSIVGRAVLERRPYRIADISKSSYKGTSFANRHGLESLVSVPLMLRDRAVGGLTAYKKTAGCFEADDVRALCAIASQLALIIENGQLVRDTVSTLVSLARSIETKDSYTRGHSERVTFYGARLAETAGLSGHDVATIKLIGPMHDIGKVGVSEAIITKPARLSASERREMEPHPVIGERIVGSMRSVQAGMFLIRNHHERLDGGGYPDGLRGDEIPLTVRILTIADSYDAMTTKRPYRDPMSTDAALEELRRCAGSQFDPDLVDVFEGLGRRGLLAV